MDFENSLISVPIVHLKKVIVKIFSNFPLESDEIVDITDNLLGSEILGKPTHGLLRVVNLVRELSQSASNPPVWKWHDPNRLECNANEQIGYLVIPKTVAICMEKLNSSKCSGVLANIYNTSHAGRLGHYTALASKSGFTSFLLTHSHPLVAGPGGKSAVLGSNALAFCIPFTQPPLNIDFTPNAISMGQARYAMATNSLLDEGVAIDTLGRPTRNPADVINGGALLTAGGHKGFVVTLLLNLLSIMAGGDPLPQRNKKYGFLLGIVRSEYLGSANYAERTQEFIQALIQSGEVHLPGENYLNLEAKLRSDITEINIPRNLFILIEQMSELSEYHSLIEFLKALPNTKLM